MSGIEILARAIHEEYLDKQAQAGHRSAEKSAIVSWEQLPEHIRESNRRQAEDIANKLRTVGCDIGPLSGDPYARAIIEDNLDHLARMEHDRWWREREVEGWDHGSTKDIARKKSPHLVPFDELPEDVKELDRNAVRAIPQVLERAGLGIVRLAEKDREHEQVIG